MPHLVLGGEIDLETIASDVGGEAQRWGPVVLKIEASWLRSDGLAALIEGVVVEHSRPLHPVAVVSLSRGDTSVRLWRRAPVERTPAVQRWLASVAAELRQRGAGPLKTTNLPAELWGDLGLD